MERVIISSFGMLKIEWESGVALNVKNCNVEYREEQRERAEVQEIDRCKSSINNSKMLCQICTQHGNNTNR